MKQEIDIHGYNRRLESALSHLKTSDISKKNIDLILKFYENCVLEGLSKPHIVKYICQLKLTARRLNKNLGKVKKQDIQSFVRYIQEREDISVSTKHAYKITLKKFYKWLKGNNEEYPEEVRWLKGTIKNSEVKLPSNGDLLTEEEVQKLIETTEHPRDKALISMIYESGGRIGEIGSLQIGNISFDKYGILITIERGKTGSRKLRLVSSTPYLATWLENHPLKDNKKAPLWINVGNTNHGKLLRYDSIRMQLKRLFEKTGIKKRANPHSFRHARASFMANHLTEFQMNQYFGWVQGSGMPSVYVHLSGRETDAAILELNGIKQEKAEKESLLRPKKCPRCDTINSHNSKLCSKCAAILDINTAIELEEERKEKERVRFISDEIMNILMKDPETQRFLIEKIIKFGLNEKIKEIII